MAYHYPLTETGGTTAGETAAGRHAGLGSEHFTPDFNFDPVLPTWASPGLRFDPNYQQYAERWDFGMDFPLRDFFTVAAWVKSDGFSGNGFVSSDFFAAGIHGGGQLWFYGDGNGDGGTGGGTWSTPQSIGTGAWHHIAVSNDGHTVRFYIDGAKVHEVGTRLVLPSTGGSAVVNIGRHIDSWTFETKGFNGTIRDVRLYGRVLADSEVAELAPAMVDPALAGLWVGRVLLDEVKDVRTNEWATAPTAFPQQILVHVSSSGEIRLLREATIMKTRDSAPTQVVVADNVQLPTYDGVTRRGDKLIGQRFSATTTPLPAPYAPMKESGGWYSAAFTLGGAHPLNPFRHKYHPDLAQGRSISHTLNIKFANSDSPADNTVAATLTQSVSGLHKATLESRGSVTFTRVTDSGILR